MVKRIPSRILSTIYITSSSSTHGPLGKHIPRLKQPFSHPVHISQSTPVFRLHVHRLPERTSLDAGSVQEHSRCLLVIIRLTIRRGGLCHVENTRSATDGPLHDRLVCVLLTDHTDGRGDGDGVQPEVGVVARAGIVVEFHTRDTG